MQLCGPDSNCMCWSIKGMCAIVILYYEDNRLRQLVSFSGEVRVNDLSVTDCTRRRRRKIWILVITVPGVFTRILKARVEVHPVFMQRALLFLLIKFCVKKLCFFFCGVCIVFPSLLLFNPPVKGVRVSVYHPIISHCFEVILSIYFHHCVCLEVQMLRMFVIRHVLLALKVWGN